MTNSNSESGIVEILSKLNYEDLFALANTVTQGLLKISSRDDAIKAIIKYSPDVLNILRRKVMTREILFSYLDEKNVTVRLPTTKNDLIDKIIECWNARCIGQTKQVQQEFPKHTSTVTKSSQIEERSNVDVLADQFVKWYYSLMNAEGVGSEHFYPDAKFKLNLYSNNECDTTVIQNSPEEIAQAVFQIKLLHNLFFNPNDSREGIKGKMDAHGLVVVLACGTLHTQDVCVGVFEQVFGLARDPTCDNNWKIKNSELNLRSKGGVTGQPKLCDSELTSNLLMLPSN